MCKNRLTKKQKKGTEKVVALDGTLHVCQTYVISLYEKRLYHYSEINSFLLIYLFIYFFSMEACKVWKMKIHGFFLI